MPSSVIKLLQHVWNHEGEAMGGRSWDRLNGAMSSALSIAVGSGFRFARTDFVVIAEKFSFSRWGGNDRHMLGERFYSQACAVEREHGGNTTAAISFETWKGRKAFIYKDRACLSGRRLAIGSDGIQVRSLPTERFKVTSFAEDGLSVGLTSYEWVEEKSKVKSRIKMTLEMLAAQNADVVEMLGPKFKRGDVVTRVGAVVSGKVVAVNARTVRVDFTQPGFASNVMTLDPDQIKLAENATSKGACAM